jgi:hypothetical protein
MKKRYAFLSFLLLPVLASAQPVMQNAENFLQGTIVKRVICDSVGHDTAGTNMTWNYANLTSTGDSQSIWNIAPLTVNPFPQANICQEFPADSLYAHLEQTLTETRYWGSLDSSSNDGSIYYTNSLRVMKRPFTYGDTLSDSFAYTTNFSGFPVDAVGSVYGEADAWGTLTLPTGTFNNVTRVKMVRNEVDSLIGIGSIYVHITSWIWYGDTARSALLRIDSIEVTGTATLSYTDVQYLYSQTLATSVNELPAASKIRLDAHLDNSGLLLNGELEANRNYEMALFNIAGQKVYDNSFRAAGAQHRFATDVPAGSYILTIRRKGEMATLTTLKLVKQ